MPACAVRHALVAMIWWLSLSVSTATFPRKAHVSILNNPDGSSVLRIGGVDSDTVEFHRRPSPLVDQTYYRLYNVTTEESSLKDDSSRGRGADSMDCLVSGKLTGKHAGWGALSICPHVQGFLATQHGGYLLHHTRQGKSFVEKIFDRPRFVPQLHDRSKRNTMDAFHVRVLLVADRSVKKHHSNKDEAEKYLLAVMNIVHHVFHDQSLGHAVSVSVAGIVFLTRRESKAMNSSTICSWQQFLKKPRTIPAYDIAVYLTRDSVCHDESASNCKHTVGYSLVGSICDQAASCIAVKDQGLISAFTIAHEIGHSLGLTHDGLNEECPTNKFIMSPEVVTLTQPFQWSPCSSEELTRLVQSGHLHCLRSKPSEGQELPKSHSGNLYTSDEQCRLRYGPTATSCTQEMAVCQLLWCRIGSGECTTDSHPPADGTECVISGSATQGVCYRQSCVSRTSTVLEPVEGGWSEWSEWSTCSCSCGTGIAASTRDCTSPAPRNGGRPCVGVYTRYKTCNTQKCTDDHVIVQKQNQCQATNSHWTTLSHAEIRLMALSPCQLHCITNDSSILTNIAPVRDGTHCWSDKNDVCIEGECIPVGCDLQLNSGMAVDHCGVCGGNGSSCVSASRVILTGNNMGLRNVITFPVGATHAVLVLHHSSSVVILKEVASEASWLLGAESSFTLGGVKWTWKHSAMEKSLIAPGPITHGVMVMIYSLAANIKVEYSFVLPLGVPGMNQWQEAADKGELVCMDLTNGNRQPEEMCGSKELYSSLGLVTTNAAQGESGHYSWWISEWSECLGVCGQGQQVRAIFCQGNDSCVVNDTYCSSPVPHQTRHCSFSNECHYSWKTDEWSNCSTTCGSGNQTRSVYCVTLYGQTVNSAFCVSSLKPVESAQCYNTSCCGQWQTGGWSECLGKNCGIGKQIRDVSCVSKGTPDCAHTTDHCLQQERPQVETQCNVRCEPTDSSCVDTLSPEYCRLVVPQHCSESEFATRCCQSCLGHQQQ